MKHIISYSGGIGSFFTTKRVVEEQGIENVVMVFCDTLTEDEDLYRFNEDVKKHFKGVEFITLTEGRDIWECAFDQDFLYNSRVANCTVFLKMRIFKRWLKKNYKPNECILYIGFDFTETHRVKSVKENWLPYKVEFPLTKEPYYYKHELYEILENEIGIEIPRLYKMGFSHNNCGGFCFKAGIGHFKQLFDKMPKRYKYHEEKEKQLIKKIKEKTGKDVSILKRVRDGKKVNLTLEQLRKEFEDEGTQLPLFEINSVGGCDCFTF